MCMKIGILGAGDVGTTLAGGLAQRGHKVLIGTRNPSKEKLQQWLRNQPEGISTGSFSEAAAFGELLILCTRWSGTQAAIDKAGIWNFKGKILIDVTAPLAGKAPDQHGRLELNAGSSPSGGEQVQAWLQEAYVVKALNSIGHALMMDPHHNEEIAPTMFIAGNDELAKKAVTDLLFQMGWKDVADTGNISMSRHLEGLFVIWFAIGFRTGQWQHAFRLLRK